MKRVNWRKLFFEIHGWVGLNAGLLLFVVCLTGTFATISDEIDQLLDPRHRIVGPAPEAEAYDWTAMVETVEQAFPGGANQGIYAPGASGFTGGRRASAVALVAMPAGDTRKVYLDPYTGELRGHTSFFNVQRFFRTLHRRLFDGARGILVVTLTSFLLLASAVTGFGFYRGWLAQLRTLCWEGSQRRRWSDLHKLAGIWGLPFTALIAVTGVLYFAEVAAQRSGGYDGFVPPPLAQVDQTDLADWGPQPELLPASEYVAIAREEYPELDVRSLRMPLAPGQAVYVDGRAGSPLTRDRADRVHLHPFSGAVLGVQRTSDLEPLPWMSDAVDPIHFGYFGGFATQLIWFFLGLLLSGSILSGLYIWVVRTTTARKGPSRFMRGVPLAVALTLGYLVVVAVGTVDGIRAYATPAPEPVAVARLSVGSYDVRVDCEAPCDLERGAVLAFHFLGSGMPNYARAELVGPDGSTARLSGPSRRPRARLALASGETASVRVLSRDGDVFEAALDVDPQASAGADPSDQPSAWPDTARGVWAVVLGFTVLTIASILIWLRLVWRVVRARVRA